MKTLIQLMAGFNYPEGMTASQIPGVDRFYVHHSHPRQPTVYEPSICILIQGRKTLYAGGRTIVYNADNYLISSVTIPTECEFIATVDHPLLGLYIKIDMTMLHDLIAHMNPCDKKGCHQIAAINSSPIDPAMKDAVTRLIRSMSNEQDARALGIGLVREVLYRALCGEQAHMLYELANHTGNYSRIAHALTLLKNSFREKLDVERLAASAHMSVSAFHRAFKEMTGESPIQYLKKLRLNKAKDLIIQQGMKAYIAAEEVGYESASQFSREFKRYFDISPSRLRTMSPLEQMGLADTQT